MNQENTMCTVHVYPFWEAFLPVVHVLQDTKFQSQIQIPNTFTHTSLCSSVRSQHLIIRCMRTLQTLYVCYYARFLAWLFLLFGFVGLRHGCCPLLWMWLNFGNNTALAPLHLAMQNWVRYEEGTITLGSLTQTLGRKKSRQMFGTNTLWSPKEIWNRSSGGVTVSFVLLKGKRKHIRKPDCGAQEVSLWLIKRNWCEVGSDAVISQSSLEQQEELFRRNQRAKLHI